MVGAYLTAARGDQIGHGARAQCEQALRLRVRRVCGLRPGCRYAVDGRRMGEPAGPDDQGQVSAELVAQPLHPRQFG